MRFGYTILYVEDVRETLAFYEKAFGFKARLVVDTDDYGELDIHRDTTLAFANEIFVEKSIGPRRFRVNRKEDPNAAGVEISFVIEKGEGIQEAFKAAVEAGAQVVTEPEEKPWGQQVAYVRDCNGFLVEICTPVDGSEQK